jgi:hypothetical protein
MISPLSKVQKQMEMTHFGKEDAAQGVMNFVGCVQTCQDGIHQRVGTSDQGSSHCKHRLGRSYGFATSTWALCLLKRSTRDIHTVELGPGLAGRGGQCVDTSLLNESYGRS